LISLISKVSSEAQLAGMSDEIPQVEESQATGAAMDTTMKSPSEEKEPATTSNEDANQEQAEYFVEQVIEHTCTSPCILKITLLTGVGGLGTFQVFRYSGLEMEGGRVFLAPLFPLTWTASYRSMIAVKLMAESWNTS